MPPPPPIDIHNYINRFPVYLYFSPGGGGGHSQYIRMGLCRGTSKKGGLRYGHNPKKGGLRHGHESKRGGLRHGHESKKKGGGVLRTGLVKKTILISN